MKTSEEGIRLIKESEGLVLRTYKCQAGVPTIGYGHIEGVKPNMEITEEEANYLLSKDIVKYEDAVNKYVKVELKQCQFDALVDFTFNEGEGALRSSTLLRMINGGASDDDICAEFRKWNKVKEFSLINGRMQYRYKSSEGLSKRRDREVKLWLKHLL